MSPTTQKNLTTETLHDRLIPRFFIAFTSSGSLFRLVIDVIFTSTTYADYHTCFLDDSKNLTFSTSTIRTTLRSFHQHIQAFKTTVKHPSHHGNSESFRQGSTLCHPRWHCRLRHPRQFTSRNSATYFHAEHKNSHVDSHEFNHFTAERLPALSHSAPQSSHSHST